MKTHSLTTGLALLSAAFLLGCQEQGSAPTAPEAQATVLAIINCTSGNKC